MAKKKKSEIPQDEIDAYEEEIAKFIKKETGITQRKLDEKSTVPYYIDSGNYALNLITSGDMLDGGFPGAKTVDFFGFEQTGKSVLIKNVAGGFLRGEFRKVQVDNMPKRGLVWPIDTEDEWDVDSTYRLVGGKELAAKMRRVEGVRTLEDFKSFIVNLVEKKRLSKDSQRLIPIFIPVDSISQLPQGKEVDDALEGKNKSDMGRRAKEIKSIFRIIDNSLSDANITLYTNSQAITDTNVSFGDPTTTSGGKGVNFASDVRYRMYKAKTIEDKETGHSVGTTMNIKIAKNRLVIARQQITIDFYNTTGVDRYSGLPGILSQYGVIEASAKKLTDASTLSYLGQEFKVGEFSQWVRKNGEEDLIKEWNQKYVERIAEIESRHEELLVESYESDEEDDADFFEG